MHPNGVLLERLFTALNAHDHEQMAACYHPAATFHDIAFDLPAMQSVPCMWHMICKRSNITADFKVIEANDVTGRVKLVDRYDYKEKFDDPNPGRPVRNEIDSRFRFREGLIVEHIDDCDPRVWAAQAVGGWRGFLAGRLRFLRIRGANKKLKDFVLSHPQHKRSA